MVTPTPLPTLGLYTSTPAPLASFDPRYTVTQLIAEPLRELTSLSKAEIAANLGVRTGTIKSRLFRLYQRLGVKKRPAAVLRAQEVLAA